MILCGTDFSVPAQAAAKAAAALARKQQVELLLVTVLQSGSGVNQDQAEQQLSHEAQELRRAFEIDVKTLVAHGLPAEQLLLLSKTHPVRVLVVGAARSDTSSRGLGVVQEHLCQRAEVPVLVVREVESLISWGRGQHALQVLVGSGLGDASGSALACVGGWPEVAVTVLHVAWPYGEHYRLGIGGPLPREHLLPEVEQQLLGDLARWAMDLPCRATTPKLRVTAGWGRIDSHLAEVARETKTDLLVVGTHERNLHEPTWQSSTSRSAVQGAACNVLCVPERYMARSAAAPRLLVVPTDFTRLADRAISFGASLLSNGGRLHLVHVAPEPLSDATRAQLVSELEQRVPKHANLRGIVWEVRVLQGNPVWLTIWQHAARARADVICMSMHSKDSSFALGAQTKALLQHAQIPVLLVPQDRET